MHLSLRAMGAIQFLFALAATAAAGKHLVARRSRGHRELRESSLQQLPASATVLDAHTLEIAGVQHFQDVLGLVPNLNWAAGTSRPRYFQLRGIGELEQWQGAPNPSVGFLIDGIDFRALACPRHCSTWNGSRCCAARRARRTAQTRSQDSSR